MNTGLINRTLVLLGLLPFMALMLAGSLHAEEKKPKVKAEDLVEIPEKPRGGGLETLRRAKLTEEQAVNQLKYMMVKGWARIDKELVNSGTFKPMGMVLSPEGEFRPLYIAEQEKMDQALALGVITKNLAAIAQTRSMWGVGIMYINGKQRKDGTWDQRIMVMTEHIAGWARHWTYPFKVVDGEVKLGAPIESNVKPVYFVKKQR